jgi:hypothetical protein
VWVVEIDGDAGRGELTDKGVDVPEVELILKVVGVTVVEGVEMFVKLCGEENLDGTVELTVGDV